MFQHFFFEFNTISFSYDVLNFFMRSYPDFGDIIPYSYHKEGRVYLQSYYSDLENYA